MTGSVGLIAGTGFSGLALEAAEEVVLASDYGAVEARRGRWHVPVVFVPRHGPGHAVPPHLVNYRAIIAGLAAAGVRDVFAVNVVGGVHADLRPGAMVCVDDFLDFTRSRVSTFGEGPGRGGVVHVDMTYPYDAGLRAEVLAAAEAIDQPMADGGVYACFEGPRFETPAEIRMAARLGASVVGMTGVPEVCLAAEAGLRYAAISLVVNPAAGVVPEPISTVEIDAVLENCRLDMLAVLDQVLAARAAMS